MSDRFGIPGLRLWHLFVLVSCLYLLQAIATADGAFKLNHALAIAIKERGYSGFMQSLRWMDRYSDSIDKWSAEQFGKDPWAMQGEMLGRFTSDCVTTPGRGFASRAEINRFRTAKKKDLSILGTPLCVAVSGNWRYLTDDPNVVFEVNPQKLDEHGIVKKSNYQ